MPTLYVLQGPDKGYTIQIIDDLTVLGRHSDQVALTDNTISREHAHLEHTGTEWRISDADSANGTYVNGERISQATSLMHGDQIKIGGTLMVFGGRTQPGGEDSAATQRRLVDVAAAGSAVDSSILSAVQANEESIILAAPEAADAVRAWNLMYQLAEAIGAISSITEFLERVTDILQANLTIERVFILMHDDATGEMSPVVVRQVGTEKPSSDRITTSRTIINHVLETKAGVLCANAVADERFRKEAKAASLQDLALRSVICVPILARDEVRGVIHLDCAMARHSYTQNQLRVVSAVGRICGMASENLRLLRQRMRGARLAAIGETVAYLSHHIRNLLQGLMSGADVVEMGLKKDNEQNITNGWRIVQNNLERIHHLTTNMLTFSKDREPRIQMADLNGIIDDAAALAHSQADDKKVMLLADLGDLPPVPVDPDGIHQAVFNLIINAIAACEPESGRVNVSTSHDAESGLVRISVSDNGSGIETSQMKHIFQPFHSSKGQGGTGLGLAASKKIVDELHGSMVVRSEPGKGTTFEISLPTTQPQISDADKTHGASI